MYNRYRDWMRKKREWAAERARVLDGVVWDHQDMSVIRGHHPIWTLESFLHQMIDQVLSIFLCGLCILFVS